ncbi:hypothetical protein D3C78_1483090 [compost metagenome]
MVADGQVAAHLLDGVKQAVELFAVGFSTTGDFTNLAFHTGGQAGNVFQVLARLFDLLDPAVKVCG